jgi:hypothetical protein
MWATLGIIVILYFYHLNTFLSGRLKRQIESFLVLCWLGLITVIFIEDWRLGLAWVAASVLLGFVLRPLARFVAAGVLQAGPSWKALGYLVFGIGALGVFIFLSTILRFLE